MNDSLIPGGSNFPETREEFLSRQFYEWEVRGRGWQVFDFPVELEPPFRPFFLLNSHTASPIVDDGKRETFLSSLAEKWRGNPSASLPVSSQNQLAEYEAFLAEADTPVFCRYYSDEFKEFQLILPKDLKVTKSVAEQLLLSFSFASHPISFEVVGNAETIVAQLASTAEDSLQIKQQIKAHLPEARIVETNEYLSESWLSDGGGFGLIVDFGLSEEFMLPLNSVTSFETDPLVAVIGALSDLKKAETGIFQILFQRTKAPWAEEMLDAVRFFDGTPFFANAPEMIPLTKDKASRPLFAAVIRVAARSFSEERCWRIAKNLGAALAPLSNPVGNELIPLANDYYPESHHQQSLLNRCSFRPGMLLNSAELVSLVHPPSASVQSEKLLRESEKTKSCPNIALGHSLILGKNHHGSEIRKVSLSSQQRTKHLHLIGSSGSGKSTLLLNLIRQDLEAGQGLCVIDPHGDLIDDVVLNVPEHRLKDVILFDPSDSDFPIGFNIIQAQSELEKTILASDLIATFRRMSTSWGDVMDSVLANAILAFVESRRGGTLFDLKRFLVEKEFRNEFLETVEDEAVRYFWQNEFPSLSGKPQSSIVIRLDTFLRQKLIRNIVCQKEMRLNFRAIMDNRKVLLIKLSQGLIGEENALLLGTLLVSKIYQTALTRQDTSERPYFWLYMDEFHNFITPSMEGILSGARKYNLGLILAHQEFRQLQSRSLEVASSVLSNCYTRICFRLGDTDAERFAGGFSFFDAKALQNLSVGEAIARIERAEYDFNLSTYPAPKIQRETAEKRKAEIVRNTREPFAKPKAEVEAELKIAPKTEPVVSSPANEIKPHQPENQTVTTSAVKEVPKANAQEHQKTSTPPAEPAEFSGLPASLPPAKDFSEKGMQQHKYLQSLVKRMAESKGFLVTIEKEVFGGIGKIDVALENESQKIACEISVTNEPDYEAQNIQKCLSANYSPVIVISADKRHLGKIRQKAEENLSAEDFAKTGYFLPEEFHFWLENLETSDAESEEKVKGFRVKVQLKPVDETDRPARKKAISEVVFGALKRLKNKPKDE